MGAVLIHQHRSARASRMQRFPTDLDAITALASQVLCRDDCVSHTIAYATDAGIALVCLDTPRTTDLETLYPRPHGRDHRCRYPPSTWPRPSEFNEPLGDPPRPSVLAQRWERGRAIELRRQLVPGRPAGRPFECAACGRVFDAGEPVMYEQAHPYRGPIYPVHPQCCSLVAGGTYERRHCAGCERPIIVRAGSPRTACAPKCRQRAWRAAVGG
jgi:hypothetical protein